MILNYFEETVIKNRKLPIQWQSQKALDELSGFLQLNWEQRASLYKDKENTTRQQFIQFAGQKGIRTNNYVGTIVFKGQQLNIFPKVFKECENDTDKDDLQVSHLMKNLVQWLEYCTKINYPFLSIASELQDVNDLRELFITLYVRFVKAALDRGLFYRYEDKTQDCTTVRGTMNIKEYICKKIPNGKAHRFECTYSEFEFDNQVNRILKHTCKILINETTKANQIILRHVLMKLNDVTDESFTPHDCDKLQLSNAHNQYRIIMSMSKMFLINKTSSYNIDNTESFCFLFPTELLFEGFIGGYVQTLLDGQAKVRIQASEVSLVDDIIYVGASYGKAFRLKHDILIEHKEKGIFILDTKYKMIDRFEGNEEFKKSIVSKVSQDDLYQVREYAAKRGTKDAYLLYPMFRYEQEEPYMPKLEGQIEVDSVKHNITVHLVRLPFVFEDDIEATKKMLARTLNKIFI
jgi:5-methylcytosine-specific restriction endonuclease McrBC regulatory subunit McrC